MPPIILNEKTKPLNTFLTGGNPQTKIKKRKKKTKLKRKKTKKKKNRNNNKIHT